MESDQAFLEFIVKGLVDQPDKVEIQRVVDEMGVLLTLTVAPEDMGKIIGKAGNTAKSIRTLLRVVGMKNDARVNLKIEEPEGGRAPYSGASDEVSEAPEPQEEAPAAPQSEAAKEIDDVLGDLKI